MQPEFCEGDADCDSADNVSLASSSSISSVSVDHILHMSPVTTSDSESEDDDSD